jgi:glyoxylase-like metal-dependent hydrolase (beta-lactamase superfamily II)
VVETVHKALAPDFVKNWKRRFPGQIPDQLFAAEALDNGTFNVEGNAVVAVDIGHADTDYTTCLNVPSIGLVVAGDAIYNGTHPYLVESGPQGFNDWLAAIDTIEALNPRAVVVGHGPLDPDNSPRHIQKTRRYIRDFIRLNEQTTTAEELYKRMLALYPDRLLWMKGLIPDRFGGALTPQRPLGSPRPNPNRNRNF